MFNVDYSLSSPTPVSLTTTSNPSWADFLSGVTSTIKDTAGAIKDVAQTVADTRYELEQIQTTSGNPAVTPAPTRPTASPLVLIGVGIVAALVLKKLMG